mmetsp:Transcript_5318/g.12841  ORF Transcript_5318/g.12841 Transcript_5318/m.12841 type:complete len:543 (-) Transcript_5318:98-1726(-)
MDRRQTSKHTDDDEEAGHELDRHDEGAARVRGRDALGVRLTDPILLLELRHARPACDFVDGVRHGGHEGAGLGERDAEARGRELRPHRQQLAVLGLVVPPVELVEGARRVGDERVGAIVPAAHDEVVGPEPGPRHAARVRRLVVDQRGRVVLEPAVHPLGAHDLEPGRLVGPHHRLQVLELRARLHALVRVPPLVHPQELGSLQGRVKGGAPNRHRKSTAVERVDARHKGRAGRVGEVGADGTRVGGGDDDDKEPVAQHEELAPNRHRGLARAPGVEGGPAGEEPRVGDGAPPLAQVLVLGLAYHCVVWFWHQERAEVLYPNLDGNDAEEDDEDLCENGEPHVEGKGCKDRHDGREGELKQAVRPLDHHLIDKVVGRREGHHVEPLPRDVDGAHRRVRPRAVAHGGGCSVGAPAGRGGGARPLVPARHAGLARRVCSIHLGEVRALAPPLVADHVDRRLAARGEVEGEEPVDLDVAALAVVGAHLLELGEDVNRHQAVGQPPVRLEGRRGAHLFCTLCLVDDHEGGGVVRGDTESHPAVRQQ